MKTMHRPWGRLTYTDYGGQGTPLIFLHGTGCDATDWDDVIPELTGTGRCVCLEFRGHGHSAVPRHTFTLEDLADDVMALMDAEAFPQVILVGHSLGGMVSMAVAARDKRVRALVLIEGWTSLRAAATAFSDGRFYGHLDAAAVDRIRGKDAWTRQRFQRGLWRHFWRSVESFDATAFLSQADLPILEIYGALGKTKATRSRLRVPVTPRIRLRWIPDAGHYLLHEKPATVAGLCRSFLKRSGHPLAPPG